MSEPGGQEQVRWLDADELTDWVTINAMLIVLPAALDVALQRDAQLTLFSYGILARLSESPDRTQLMSDLAGITHGSLSKLSHAVAGLERRGWVRRQPYPQNGRYTVATLTDAGYAKLAASAPGHVAAVRRLLLDPLDTAERTALAGAARRILDAIGEPSPADPPGH